MSSWTKSSVSLSKLHETQKPLNDKSGLGFSFGENSSEETCTQSDLAGDKFKKMNFVKAGVIHDVCESVKYDDQFTGQLNHKGKNGIGYIKPENCKPSWLTNRLEKDKRKYVPKSSVQNHQRCDSTKAKWVKVQPKRDLNGQTLDSPHDDIQIAQTDLTGNIEVIDLNNVDQVQEQIATSVPAAGDDGTTIAQDAAQADDTICQEVSRPASDTQAINSSYQLVSNEAIQPDIQAEQGENPIGSDLWWNRNHPPEQIIEGVMTKMGNRVVEVHSLKTEADRVEVVVVEVEVNIQREEVVHK
ncbi:hypothetical protein F511_34927 [Dorcoceras hygrometricum]|uniref:Uncharacterized protein n=1 Tax=Dorcoceras hygrometricum TaxID=472368 RepID=A0A2Z7D9X7_9LAMI|nr:hypothetical protein F511_34927 [Dorcoceras hygrometricum]